MYLYNYLELTFILSKDQTVWFQQIKESCLPRSIAPTVNFEPIFTNEVSKSKLRLSLSTNLSFVNSSEFTAETFFSKLVHVF